MNINIGPISDAFNALAATLDAVRAALARNAQDATNLQTATDAKAASDQAVVTAKSASIAALDQYGSLVAQFVQDTKTALS